MVTATGSSKKIAKNLAAAEMLQKLKNASPEVEGSKEDRKIQKGEEKRGGGVGGGEALHQLVNISRDKLAELGGMLFLETLAQEQNFVLTVIEVEAVGERVEVLVQVQALKVFQCPQWILTRLLRSREAQLQQSVLGWGLIMRRPGWHLPFYILPFYNFCENCVFLKTMFESHADICRLKAANSILTYFHTLYTN